MKNFTVFIAITFTTLLAAPHSALAVPVIDDNAPRVLLQSSCTEAGVELSNCFEDLDILHTWIFGTRVGPTNGRTALTPLLVDVGPGIFPTTQFQCTDSGYISFRGSGRQHTTLYSGLDVIGGSGTVFLLNETCNLEVSDLTITSGSSLQGAILFNGGAAATKTTWTNVDVISNQYGWNETGCAIENNSVHYWFGSTITVTTGSQGFARAYTSCGHTWLYGSEITARATAELGTTDGRVAVGIRAQSGEIHIYGGNVRSIAEPGISMAPAGINTTGSLRGVVAVGAIGGAEVHIHGTGIDTISEQPNDIVAIMGSDNSFVHASESAYVLKTGTGGTKTRIRKLDNTDIRAPQLWHTSTTPPDILSVDGSDIMVETDCSPAGCQVAGSDPHVLIYKNACNGEGGGPWFDTSTGICRDSDRDNDGLSDDDEVYIYGTDPLIADTDGDDLSDGIEINTQGTDPLLKDSDGDSHEDGDEVSVGSDPLNSTSYQDNPGDINNDFLVDITDVLLAQQALFGQISLTPTQLLRADVAPLLGGVPTPNGIFNLGDMLVIQRKTLGLSIF